MPFSTLPSNYAERTYAGVLGKLIGVYLGRPFEQWSHERIEHELDEIRYYVHEKLGHPLVVTDDDITGTFTFFRALADHGFSPDLTPTQIGETWLNYIIPLQSILWWGGVGMSTEHTAWHRLSGGVTAPDSGSIALNGKTVAEQIGAQIFIDAWGLLHPGDPAAAANWAARAARVSHDGEAVFGAQVVAALVAAAFVERDIPRLLDLALAQIPADCLLRRMADDVCTWHAQAPADWRATLRLIQQHYGYDKFPGVCHIIPNHALIHLALLHSGGDFSEAQMIVNTAGWDTDCNAGNVGCILGVRNGLASLDAGPDWRAPVADRLWLPTSEGGATISDAVRETYFIINAASRLRALPPLAPKSGARFHFSLPGSVQGFVPDPTVDSRDTLTLVNQPTPVTDTRVLAWHFKKLGPGRAARAFTATFTPPQNFASAGYAMSACPTLHPGQTVRARVLASASNDTPVTVRLVLRAYDEDKAHRAVPGPAQLLAPGAEVTLAWLVSPLDGYPICDIGLEITTAAPASGTVLLDWLDWRDAPADLDLMPCAKGDIWQCAWIKAIDGVWNGSSPPASPVIDLHHGGGLGVFAQGSRDWRDYTFSTRLTVRLADTVGLAVRVQGLRRYYALLLSDGLARLVKRTGPSEQILAEASCATEREHAYDVTLAACGSELLATFDGRPLLSATDTAPDALDGGACAFILAAGSLRAYSAWITSLR